MSTAPGLREDDMTRVDGAKTLDNGATIVKTVNEIKEKVGNIDASKIITEGLVKSAEQTIENEKENYVEKIMPELEMLEKAYENYKDDENIESDDFQQMRSSALRIKSSAGMNDYTLATEIARFLYMFLSDKDPQQKRGKEIIQIHLDALRIVFAKKIKGDGGKIGIEVAADLEKLVNLWPNKIDDDVDEASKEEAGDS